MSDCEEANGLRQRKLSGDKREEEYGLLTEEHKKNYLEALANSTNLASVLPIVERVSHSPIWAQLGNFVERVAPFLNYAYEKYMTFREKSAPYKLGLLLPSVYGLIMCFYGGVFMTVIAAAEAFRMIGYQSIVDCINLLWIDFNIFMEANKNDNLLDEDRDGVADYLQVSVQQLATRKTLLFLRSVDPNRILLAIYGINSGFLAIVATLKLQFAMAIALGNSIADTIEKPLKTYVLPIIDKKLPDEYKKWAQPLLTGFIKSFAISIAWFIHRVLAATHSGMKGGLMFSRNLIEYLSVMNIVSISHEDTILDEVLGYTLAGLGIYHQLHAGFARSFPFPLNILLSPLTFLEWFLMYTIASR